MRTTTLEELSRRVDALERQIAEAGDVPKACRSRTCSFYSHYLATGPADLTHEGYHAAEAKHLEAHEGYMQHVKAHLACPHPRCWEAHRNPYAGQCEYWEKATRS